MARLVAENATHRRRVPRNPYSRQVSRLTVYTERDYFPVLTLNKLEARPTTADKPVRLDLIPCLEIRPQLQRHWVMGCGSFATTITKRSDQKGSLEFQQELTEITPKNNPVPSACIPLLREETSNATKEAKHLVARCCMSHCLPKYSKIKSPFQ